MTSRFNREKFANRATVKVPEDPADQDPQSNQQGGFASMESTAQVRKILMIPNLIILTIISA